MKKPSPAQKLKTRARLKKKRRLPPGVPNPVDIHVGGRVRLRRTLLGLSQENLGDAVGLTFQQIQKYEKGTNGVSSIRLLQLSNYLKVPINYFFEDFSEYLINLDKSKEGHMNVNYNFLVKLYSELNDDQKLKFAKSLQPINLDVSKVG